MTEQKHLKALIRSRMARTGESYTTARSHIVKREARPSLTTAVEFRAHDKHCMTAVFTPDDMHLVSGGFGGQARIWTLDGSLVGELVGHESAVSAVRISPDGATAITASSDKTVRVWDLPARHQRAVLGAHRKQVLALDLDAARDRLWSGGHDGRLNAWRLSTGAYEAQLDLGGSVSSVAVRSTDGVVAAATVGAGVAILGANGDEIARLAESAKIVASVAWAADGSFLIGSSPGGATVWAADGWEAVRSLESGPGSMLPVALSPDGSRIALGWDHHIGLWGADESQPGVTINGLPKGVYGLAFSHDGRSLAAAAADGRVRLWSVTQKPDRAPRAGRRRLQGGAARHGRAAACSARRRPGKPRSLDRLRELSSLPRNTRLEHATKEERLSRHARNRSSAACFRLGYRRTRKLQWRGLANSRRYACSHAHSNVPPCALVAAGGPRLSRGR